MTVNLGSDFKGSMDLTAPGGRHAPTFSLREAMVMNSEASAGKLSIQDPASESAPIVRV